MLMFLFINMILAISYSSLRIPAIYFKCIGLYLSLYAGVLVLVLSVLVDSGVGGIEALFPATTYPDSMLLTVSYMDLQWLCKVLPVSSTLFN